MKRSKNDHIRSTIHRYLKKRQFTEAEMPSRKDGSLRPQTVSDMCLRRQTRSRSSPVSTLTLASVAGEANAYIQQYARLERFIETSVSPYKSQLEALLFPMFANIYLDMLSNGQKDHAHKFHDSHSEKFSPQSHTFVKLIRGLNTKSSVLTNKTVAQFRENRTVVKLDQETVDYLMVFLKADDCMLLLQVLNQYLQIEVTANSEKKIKIELNSLPEVLPENEPSTDQNVNSTSTPSGAPVIKVEAGVDNPEEDLASAIKAVRELPPCLPSICFYTFMNTYQGLCSTTISPDKQKLSASFEDSSIHVWGIEPAPFTRQPSDDVSRVALAADLIHSTDEENRERLNNRLHPSSEKATLLGHRGAVYKTSFLSDSNSHLLSCSEDCTVRLWDLPTQSNSVIYKGHTGPVWSLATSSTDTWFASCSSDTTAKLWTFDRTYPLRSYVGHSMDVDCIAFHPNNNYLATGSADKTVRLWSVTEARSVRLFQGHRASVLALAFSPTGNLLASAGEDRRVRVWDLSSGQVVKELRGHSDTVYALAFDTTGRILASGGADCCLRLWDVTRPAASTNVEGHSSAELLGGFPTKSSLVSHVCFSQYNTLLAAGASS